MKKDFFDTMDKIMQNNPNVYLIFVGLGYPRYDALKKKYKDRVINTEASEQTALDIAVGLTYENKIPFVYTITPFLYRGFETIRTYINHEKLAVKMVGAGRNDDYGKQDGFSHDATDIKPFFDLLSNIKQYYPETKEELPAIIDQMVNNNLPCYLNLRR